MLNWQDDEWSSDVKFGWQALVFFVVGNRDAEAVWPDPGPAVWTPRGDPEPDPHLQEPQNPGRSATRYHNPPPLPTPPSPHSMNLYVERIFWQNNLNNNTQRYLIWIEFQFISCLFYNLYTNLPASLSVVILETFLHFSFWKTSTWFITPTVGFTLNMWLLHWN